MQASKKQIVYHCGKKQIDPFIKLFKMLQLLSDQHLKSLNFFLILINQPVQSGYGLLAQGSVSAI